MTKEQPSYYAIIPANVRYNTDLKANEKLMYGEITCLAHSTGNCYASNQYFADLYGVSKETVSRWINNLKSLGFIKVKLIYRDGTKEIINRYIQINHEGIDEKINTPIDEKINTPIDEKINTPIDEKIKDNTTRLNTTSNNKDSLSSKPDYAEKILEHLNLKAGRSYRPVPSNIKLIQARLSEGNKPQDLIAVINRKCLEWLDDPKMAQFLRPSTLFNATKFNDYVGQLDSPLPAKSSGSSHKNRHSGFDKKDYTRGLIEQEDGTYAF